MALLVISPVSHHCPRILPNITNGSTMPPRKQLTNTTGFALAHSQNMCQYCLRAFGRQCFTHRTIVIPNLRTGCLVQLGLDGSFMRSVSASCCSSARRSSACCSAIGCRPRSRSVSYVKWGYAGPAAAAAVTLERGERISVGEVAMWCCIDPVRRCSWEVRVGEAMGSD